MKLNKKTIKILVIGISSLLAILVVVGLVVCRRDEEPPPTPTPEIIEETPEPEIIEVESIRIILESTEIIKGTRFIPEVIIQPEDATDKTFELHSENEDVLRPHGQYWIAAEVGEADLIATAANGIMGLVTVIVVSPIESVEFEEDEITLELGDTITLTPTTVPENAIMDLPIRFTSDNGDVALVMGDGTIVAVGAGTAIIECTVGDVSTTIKVTVVIPVRQIIINLDRRVYSIGNKVEFSVRVFPEDTTEPSYTISYSGAAVNPAGNNSFVCAAAGDVTITATAENGVSGNLVITVYDLLALAEEVHRLTNAERVRAGSPELIKMPSLTQAAGVRANEIITSFSHTRPDGRSFLTALDEKNIPYTLAGENIAGRQRNPAEAMQTWMNSQIDRDIILESGFVYLGVGVSMDSNGSLYWTLLFTD